MLIMRKFYVFTVFLIALFINAEAQNKKPVAKPNDTNANVVDSIQDNSNKEISEEGETVVALDENDMDNSSNENVSSYLAAGRDPYYSPTAYNFFSLRYKYRAYDAGHSQIVLNGMPLENLETGSSMFGLIGGLTDVVRNREVSLGNKANSFSFGGMGVNTNFDTRASKQRAQTQFGYTYSNGSFTHRWTLTHSTGMNKKGWAFTFSGSRRWSDESYVPGTYINSWSYFAGIDKKINDKQLLSFVVFNSVTENGGESYETKEAFDLTGSHYYNSSWGYQMGKKRNANVTSSNEPVFILSHDFKINPKTSLLTSVGYTTGQKGRTSLDWYNAADPYPDYYQYMPSYFLFNGNNDTAMSNVVANSWRNNPAVRQIDWNNLYQSNWTARDTVSGLKGARAHYLLAEDVTATKRFNFNTTFNTVISQKFLLTGGLSYQSEVDEHYRKAKDLLGADYYIDVNSYAQFDYNTPQYNQKDTVVRQGGKYSYDYEMHINKAAGWLQGTYKFNHLDVFMAVDLSNTQFYRNGLFYNTVFPTTSLGKSNTNNFDNYGIKGGFTYKVNGRNYIYANEYFATIAPNYNNVYLSPNTRSLTQDQISSMNVKSMEVGYIYNSPKVKMRLAGYYTESDNEMQVRSYYDELLVNTVNVALRNISKLYYGLEWGGEIKPVANLTVNGTVGINRAFYNSRQYATETIDNVDSIVSKDTVYSKNYRIGSTPQEVFTLGFTYRSPKYWYIGLSANYFDELWADISPIRREYRSTTGAPYGSAQWQQIINQEQLPSNYRLDLTAGYSWKLPKSFGMKKPTFVNFNLGINNLLNNQNIIANGHEQLRYDSKYFQEGAFPNKYVYAMGINFHLGANIRF